MTSIPMKIAIVVYEVAEKVAQEKCDEEEESMRSPSGSVFLNSVPSVKRGSVAVVPAVATIRCHFSIYFLAVVNFDEKPQNLEVLPPP